MSLRERKRNITFGTSGGCGQMRSLKARVGYGVYAVIRKGRLTTLLPDRRERLKLIASPNNLATLVGNRLVGLRSNHFQFREKCLQIPLCGCEGKVLLDVLQTVN